NRNEPRGLGRGCPGGRYSRSESTPTKTIRRLEPGLRRHARSPRTKAHADRISSVENRDNRCAGGKFFRAPASEVSRQLIDVLDGHNIRVCRPQLRKCERGSGFDRATKERQIRPFVAWSFLEVAKWGFAAGQEVNLAGQIFRNLLVHRPCARC